MYQVVINVSFLEDFTYVLNGWPQPLIFNTVFLKKSLKGGLSGRMALQFFKCFRVIFSYEQNALFEFLTSQTGQMAFTVFKVIIR